MPLRGRLYNPRMEGMTLAETILIALPFIAMAVTLIVGAGTLKRKRIRYIAIAVIGFDIMVYGWGASWPVPNYATSAMMLGGLVAFLAATFWFFRSLRQA